MGPSGELISLALTASFMVGLALAIPDSLQAQFLGASGGAAQRSLKWFGIVILPLLLPAGLLVDEAGARAAVIVGSLMVSGSWLLWMAAVHPLATWCALGAAAAGAASLHAGSVVLGLRSVPANTAASTSLVLAFTSLGALAGGPLTGALFGHPKWRRGLGFVALFCLVPAGIAVVAPTLNAEAQREAEVPSNPVPWLGGVVFGVYLVLEGSIAVWSADGLSKRGPLWPAGFWLAFLGSRLLAAGAFAEEWLPRGSESWVPVALALAVAVTLGNLGGSSAGVRPAGWLTLAALLGPIYPAVAAVILDNGEPGSRGVAYGVAAAAGWTIAWAPAAWLRRASRRASVPTSLRMCVAVAVIVALAALLLALSLQIA